MRIVRRSAAIVALSVLGSALTVVAPLASAGAAAPAEARAETRPFVVGEERPPVASDETDPEWLSASVTVPPAETVEVDVPASGWVVAGSLPVSVARPSSGVAVSRVRVRMLSQSEVAAVGGRLLGFELTRADGGSAAGSVAVSLDYSGIAKAYGGDFASRLRLVRVADCGAGAPCLPASAGAANDASARRLRSMRVSVAADPAVASGPSADSGMGPQPSDPDAGSLLGAPTMFAATSGPSGPNGDFTASQLSSADRWDVGVGSGGFTYSYPFALPPAPYGPTPSLSLDYSSQSVDGRNAAANGQAPTAGEGWTMEPGFIERRFHSCADEGGGADLCWSANNEYFLHFGGHSGELIRNGSTNEWRLGGNDPAWRILSFTGASNSDNDGEYFLLITPDGTKYWFGNGVEPGGTPAVTTGSTYEVPVFGGSGEPCYSAVAGANWCQQAYRWNVDRVEDTNANVTTLFYAKEYNYYARAGTASLPTRYVRAGSLLRIEYGQRSFTEQDPAAARVLVTTTDRCAAQTSCPAPTASNATAYPDVPLELMCTATSCTVDNSAPTFWSTKQIATVATQYWDAASAGYDTASIYTMSYSFPPTGDGTTPSLWLTDVTHTGYYGSGSVALPSLHLDGVNKQNRVNTGAGVPALNKWRVETINTELGARVDVTYGLPDPCPTTAVDWWVNPYDCYPAWYDPHDQVTAAGWVAFHKYVVTDVAIVDLRGGQPTRSTHYTYNDTPAWHHTDSLLTPPSRQSWSEYRGYSNVRVTTAGDATSVGTDTRYLLFRGMYGDKLTSTTTRTTSLTDSTGATFNDYDSRAGLPLEVKSYDPTVGVLATTLHRYWAQLTVNGPNGVQSHDANFVREATTIDRVRNTTTNAWRDRQRRMTYSANTSMLLSTSDDAMPGTSADDTCAKVGYVSNAATGSTPATSEWIVDAPTRTVTYSLACEATGGVELAKTEYYYDNQAFSAVPTHANVTQTWTYSDATTTAITKTGYDGAGRVTSQISPNEVAAGTNGATTISYVPSARYPSDGIVTTNVLGQRTTAVSYFAFGTPRETTDVNGHVTSYTVDALGRVLSVSRPGDAAGTPSLTFAYVVGLGQTNRVTTNRLRSGTSYLTSYEYIDGLGRSVQTQERDANDGGTGPGRRLTMTSYDPFGRVAARTQPFGATGTPGQYLAVVDPAAVPLETRYKHDSAGRTYWTAQHAHDALSFATRNVYDGWGYTVDAPVRGDVDVTVDILGRTTAVTEHGLAAPVTTNYGYTRLGDLATIVDDDGNMTSYGYDWLRRRTSSIDPDQGEWLTTYDRSGNVIAVRDAKLQTVTTNYDRIGRRTATKVGATTLATWTYDTATVPNAKGRLASATRKVGTDDYTTSVTGYDPRGRVTGKSWTVPQSVTGLAGTYAYSYTYDPMDNLASVILPAAGGLSAETVTTVRNNAALPTRLTSSLGTDYVAATTYALDGRVAQRTLPGITRSYGYDTDAGRLSTIQSTTTGGGLVEDLAYTHNDNNDVTSVSDSLAGAGGVPQRECFGYDALSRLTSAFTTNAAGCVGAAPVTFGADPYNQTYIYNPVGDLTSLTSNGITAAYIYGVAGHAHAAATIAGAAYAYDANGATTTRPTSGGTQTLGWNELHQLASITGAGAATFVYGADGTRLVRTSGSTATLYLDGMEVTASPGGVSATRYYGGFAMRTPSGVSVLLHNHQGSTTTAVDTVSGAVTRQRYTPFGARRGATPLVATDRRFLAQPEDGTGLVAAGARYYDPAVARFVSVDPLADLARPQSFAGYSYARNNPTSLSDPGGLEPHQNSDGSWGGMGCADDECNGSVGAAEDNRNATLAVRAEHDRTRRKVEKILAQLDATKARDRNEYWAAAARDCPPGVGGALCETYYRMDVVESTLHPPGVLEWTLDVASILLLLLPLVGPETAAARATAAEGAGLRALTSAEQRTLSDALRPAKLDHVFVPKHNLDPLIQQFGSREAAMEQIVRSIGGTVPRTGPFEIAKDIGGQTVVIRGAVLDGIPRIGTVFTP